MAAVKFSFEDFIGSVEIPLVEFLTGLHRELTEGGCKIEVKEAKADIWFPTFTTKSQLQTMYFAKKESLYAFMEITSLIIWSFWTN